MVTRIALVRSRQDLNEEARATLERLHPGATFDDVEPRTSPDLRREVDPVSDGVFLRMTALPEDCLKDGVPCYFIDPETGKLRRLTRIVLESVPVE